MKLTVRKQDLQLELGLIQGIVEAKATIPILSHILLEAGKNGLGMVATDLEAGLRTSCAADVSSPGSVAVPAKKLHDIVRALDCDVISFESEGNFWLKIEGGSYRSRIVGLPHDDFPPQPAPKASTPRVRVPLVVLQQIIARSLFAVTAENTRFSINGALLKISQGMLTLVATDGHRLALVRRESDLGDVAGEMSALVPRKALMEINRVRAADDNEEVAISLEGPHAFFEMGARVLTTRLLEGTFPAYEKVIPEDSPITARVPRRMLQEVINRVGVLTSDSLRLITMNFAADGLTVATSNPNAGEASEQMAIEISGGETKIGLNHEYLLQFLAVADSDQIDIRLRDSNTQALFEPVSSGPLQYRYVIMPMRLS